MSSRTARSGPRTLTALGILALLMSLLAIAGPAVAVTEGTGNIAVFKDMCQDFGQQDTCNGRDDSLDGFHIDYTVEPADEDGNPTGDPVEIIVVTLGENAGGGGNVGGGSQGRAEGGELEPGHYLVCETEVAYNDDDPPIEVPLDALPRPDASGGGSTGGSQEQYNDECIHVTLGTGTEEVKFLDKALDRGSLVVLKTNNAATPAPLAGAVFTLTDAGGNSVGTPQTTGANGTVCWDDLALETAYTVTETQPPAGHLLASPASQSVTVEEIGTCAEHESGPDATFVNPIIIPPTPTLVIDKVANAETITISGTTATPSTISWTLAYTLTNGPVTGATITDTLPTGLTYVVGSASPATGFSLSADGRTLTWTFATLAASGSVSFQTSVNMATISRTAPTVNVTTIDSNQTNPDTGQDQVSVTVTSIVQAGTPTPTPAPTATPAPVVQQQVLASVPNTAMELPTSGLVGMLALITLLSLGYLARRNVIERRNRR